MDFERGSFVAWNPRFLEQTGFSEDEMKSAKPEDLLAFGESWFPLSDKKEGQPVDFIPCAVRRSFDADPAPGYVVRSRRQNRLCDAGCFRFLRRRNSNRAGSLAVRKNEIESSKPMMRRLLLR